MFLVLNEYLVVLFLKDYRWIIDSLTFNLLNWNQSGISSFNVDISDQSLSPISVTNFLQHFVANFLHHFLSEQIRIITSSGFPTKYFILNHQRPWKDEKLLFKNVNCITWKCLLHRLARIIFENWCKSGIFHWSELI